jgi:hypothetical protein
MQFCDLDGENYLDTETENEMRRTTAAHKASMSSLEDGKCLSGMPTGVSKERV